MVFLRSYPILFFLLLPFATVFADAPEPPIFSHPAGTFDRSFDLEITAEEGTTIHYTVNGRAPSSFTSQYEPGQPLPISGTVMVRAKAYDEQGEASETVTKTYTQLARPLINFDSNLPLVIVHQFDDVMDDRGAYRSTVSFSVIDRKHDGRAHLLSDQLHLQSRSESNYRGSSSLQFPKKQFGVRLIDDQGDNRNEPILGMPSENNWIMYAPYDDKSLIRNAIAYQLSRDMGHYAPRTRFVELFLHDGDGPLTESHYHGVYMLVERIKWDDNRVDITKISDEDNAEPDISGGYIINYDRDVHFRSSHKNTGFALVRPQTWDITDSQRDWISNYIGDLETALFSNNFTDPDEGYAAFLEPDSFIDHHLITEALKEIDGYRLSTYMYKDRNSRVVMGPVWDFNISMGNVDYHPNSAVRDAQGYWEPDPWSPEGWYYKLIDERQYLNGWYSRLFEDPDFENRYSNRWWELRTGPFSTEHLINMIQNYAELLDEAQKRNFERWPVLGQYVWPNHFIGNTYEEEIDFLVDWVEKRMQWIDSNMPAPDTIPDKQLRYFWSFGDDLPNNTPFETLNADYAVMDHARIHFHSALDGYPFHEDHPMWRKSSMERRNRPTDINYRRDGNLGRSYKRDAMRALQIRQPFTGDGGENMLVFEMPTTNMENVVFGFAAMDEMAADTLLIDYSIAEGEPDWTTEGLARHHHALAFHYQHYELAFDNIPESDNNPDFKIRIRFDGDNLEQDIGTAVLFNNFSLDAKIAKPDIPDQGDEDEADEEVIRTFQLEQNTPNPFNPATTITYAIPNRSDVTLTVYNVMGQKIKVLVDDRKNAGKHTHTFDASDLASGVYIYELRTPFQRTSRTMTFVK